MKTIEEAADSTAGPLHSIPPDSVRNTNTIHAFTTSANRDASSMSGGRHPTDSQIPANTSRTLSLYLSQLCRFNNGHEIRLTGRLSANRASFDVPLGAASATMKIVGISNREPVFGPAGQWQVCRLSPTFMEAMLPGSTSLDGSAFHAQVPLPNGESQTRRLHAVTIDGSKVYVEGPSGGAPDAMKDALMERCRHQGVAALDGLEPAAVREFFDRNDEALAWLGFGTTNQAGLTGNDHWFKSSFVSPRWSGERIADRETDSDLITAQDQLKALTLFATSATDSRIQGAALAFIAKIVGQNKATSEQEVTALCTLTVQWSELVDDTRKSQVLNLVTPERLNTLFDDPGVMIGIREPLIAMHRKLLVVLPHAADHFFNPLDALATVVERHLRNMDATGFTTSDERSERRPLHHAAETGMLTVLRDLIEKKRFDVNAKDKDNGRTALDCAARHGHVEIVDYLLAAGASVTLCDDHRWMALHWVADNGRVDIAKRLVEAGADVNAQGKEGFTPLHWVADSKTEKRLAMAQYLLTLPGSEEGGPVDIEAIDKRGYTALYWAVDRGNLDVVTFMLTGTGPFVNANVEAAGERDGRRPLHRAVEKNDFAVATFLLEFPARIDAPDRDGMLPMHLAVRNASVEMVQLLLSSGASGYPPDNKGLTPVHWAVQSDSLDIVAVLLQDPMLSDEQRLAMVNARNKAGATALHLAVHICGNNVVGIVDCLLQHGADTGIRDGKNKTAYQVADRQKHPELMQRLMEHRFSLIDAAPKHTHGLAFQSDERIFDWLRVQPGKRSSLLKLPVRSLARNVYATPAQYQAFIDATSDAKMKKQAQAHLAACKLETVLPAPELERSVKELEKAWLAGDYTLIDKAEKSIPEQQIIRSFFDTRTTNLQWLGFRSLGSGKGIDTPNSFVRSAENIGWNRNAISTHSVPKKGDPVIASYQAKALALFAVSVNSRAAQVQGLLFLNAVLEETVNNADKRAALKTLVEGIAHFGDWPECKEALQTVLSRENRALLQDADLTAMSADAQVTFTELATSLSSLEARSVALSPSPVNATAGPSHSQALTPAMRSRPRAPTIAGGSTLAAAPESRPLSQVSTSTDLSHVSRSTTSSQLTTRTTASLRLAQQSRGVLQEKTQRLLIKHLDIIYAPGVPTTRAYYYEMSKLACITLLRGAQSRRHGVHPYDINVSLNTLQTAAVSGATAVQSAAMTVVGMFSAAIDFLEGLPAVGPILKTMLQQFANRASNMSTEALAKVLDMSAANIDIFADTTARGLTLLHLDEIDHPTTEGGSFLASAKDYYTLANQKRKGLSKGELTAETVVRLKATEHICKAIMAMAGDDQGLIDEIEKRIAGQPRYETDHKKIKPLLRWHCEQENVADVTNEKIREVTAWGVRDSSVPRSVIIKKMKEREDIGLEKERIATEVKTASDSMQERIRVIDHALGETAVALNDTIVAARNEMGDALVKTDTALRAEIAKLAEAARVKDAKIEQLASELGALQQENADIKQANENIKEQNAEIQEELGALKAMLTEFLKGASPATGSADNGEANNNVIAPNPADKSKGVTKPVPKPKAAIVTTSIAKPSQTKGKAVAASQDSIPSRASMPNASANSLIAASQLTEEPMPLMPGTYRPSGDVARPSSPLTVSTDRQRVEQHVFTRIEMKAIIVKYISLIGLFLTKEELLAKGDTVPKSSKATLIFTKNGLMVRRPGTFKVFGSTYKVEDDLKSRRSFMRTGGYTFKDDLYPWLESIGLTAGDYLPASELTAVALEEAKLKSSEPDTDDDVIDMTVRATASGSAQPAKRTQTPSQKGSPTPSIRVSASIDSTETTPLTSDSSGLKGA